MIHRILSKLLFLSDSTIKNSTGKLVKIIHLNKTSKIDIVHLG